jgi:bifunctional polynucleotide phosphatase/kinase
MTSWESYQDKNGLVYYCKPTSESLIKTPKILAIDLDGTIIKPEIGKIFPISAEDWVFAFNMKNLRDYVKDGYTVVVMSNQKGLFQGKGNLTFDDFKARWQTIAKTLKVPAYIIISPQDDFYRKPATGMWNFMKKHLVDENIKIDKSSSLYVGDAAGRRGDHSDVDIKFAINNNLRFMTPEEFFENSQDFPFDSLVKNLRGFDPRAYIPQSNTENWKELTETLNTPTNIRMILMVGSPASGKSSMAQLIKEKYETQTTSKSSTFHILSLDVEKTKKKMKDAIKSILHKDNIVIVDATSGTKKSRKEWIDVLHKINPDFKAICVYMNLPKDLSLHLNELRNLKITSSKNQEDNVPTVAIHTFWKHFEKPNTTDEEINKVIEFNFEERNEKKEDKKHFQLWL